MLSPRTRQEPVSTWPFRWPRLKSLLSPCSIPAIADHPPVKNIVNFMRPPPVCWRTWIQRNMVGEVNVLEDGVEQRKVEGEELQLRRQQWFSKLPANELNDSEDMLCKALVKYLEACPCLQSTLSDVCRRHEIRLRKVQCLPRFITISEWIKRRGQGIQIDETESTIWLAANLDRLFDNPPQPKKMRVTLKPASKPMPKSQPKPPNVPPPFHLRLGCCKGNLLRWQSPSPSSLQTRNLTCICRCPDPKTGPKKVHEKKQKQLRNGSMPWKSHEELPKGSWCFSEDDEVLRSAVDAWERDAECRENDPCNEEDGEDDAASDGGDDVFFQWQPKAPNAAPPFHLRFGCFKGKKIRIWTAAQCDLNWLGIPDATRLDVRMWSDPNASPELRQHDGGHPEIVRRLLKREPHGDTPTFADWLKQRLEEWRIQVVKDQELKIVLY